ncbi:MAG: DUF2855 family protein [Pseudomonadota bacterium]
MANLTEIWVRTDDFRATKKVEAPQPKIGPGQVLMQVDQAALTANNVTYAVAGFAIGYWGFFPTGEDGWGKVPVWGYATVLESHCEGVEPGEVIYGYWPLASHVVLEPAGVRASGFIDGAEHRQKLPGLYNQYNRKMAEPAVLKGMDTERCLYFPLFVTSYLLYDYLLANQYFGARQVVIGSASSKTAFGLAHALHHADGAPDVIGFTSPGNFDFSEALGLYDRVRTYGSEAEIDASLPTAYVDMSGDARLTTALHTHCGENLVESCMVGITHWEAMRRDLPDLPGAKPTMFFAPGQIETRDAEWGRGVIMERALAACAAMAKDAREWVSVEWVNGAPAIEAEWAALVDGKVSPKRGLMIAF